MKQDTVDPAVLIQLRLEPNIYGNNLKMKTQAPLGAKCHAAPKGAGGYQIHGFYKHSAPNGAHFVSTQLVFASLDNLSARNFELGATTHNLTLHKRAC